MVGIIKRLHVERERFLIVSISVIVLAFSSCDTADNSQSSAEQTEVLISSLYNESEGRFDIDGYEPGMTIGEVVETLGIDFDDLGIDFDENSDNCPYVYRISRDRYDGEERKREYYLAPSGSGSPNFSLAGIPAYKSLLFHDDTLVGVRYILYFADLTDEERELQIDQLIEQMSECYKELDNCAMPSEDTKYATCFWYSEYQDGKYSSLSVHKFENSGMENIYEQELFAEVAVYIDVDDLNSAYSSMTERDWFTFS